LLVTWNDGRMVRIDKWLWAARLSKTRGLAAEAVKGGRVELNGQRVKPAKEIKPGDRLVITSGPYRREVVVLELAERRVSAKEAERLYEETPESLAAREQLRAERRLAPAPLPQPGGRPTKRDRRRMDRWR
jgi:ribosome-associated heat shock protein Hsp15